MEAHQVGYLALQEIVVVNSSHQSGHWLDEHANFWVATCHHGRKATGWVVARDMCASVRATNHGHGNYTAITVQLRTSLLTLISIHLPPHGLLPLREDLAHLRAYVRTLDHPWILAGDLNVDLRNRFTFHDHVAPALSPPDTAHVAQRRAEDVASLLYDIGGVVPQLQQQCLGHTHVSWSTAATSIKDYIIPHCTYQKYLSDFLILRDMPCPSDHYPILMNITDDSPARQRRRQRQARPRFQSCEIPCYKNFLL